jgi:hypothetical protein
MKSIRGHMVVTLADTIIGADRRLRHPATQAEIEYRVGVYANQVEQHGRISWLPRRGSGLSARARAHASSRCEREWVLGEALKSQPLTGNTSAGN